MEAVPSIGGNFFEGVVFPIVIGDRYVHIATDAITGSPVIDVYRLDRDRDRLVAELLNGRPLSGAAPITVMPSSGAGAVRLSVDPSGGNLVGYLSGGTDVRTIIATADRLEVRQGEQLLVELDGNSVSGFSVGLRLDDSGIAMGGELPDDFPQRRLIENTTILVSDLVSPHVPLIDSTDFDQCAIVGPAVLALRGDRTAMKGCTFAPTPNVVLVVPDPSEPPVGVVFTVNCSMTACELRQIALMVGDEAQRQAILRSLL